MADLILQDFEAGSNGATVAPGNTAGTGQTAVSGVSGTPKFTSSALEGSLSMSCQNNVDTAAVQVSWNVTTAGKFGIMIKVKAGTPTATDSIISIRNASQAVMKVAIKTTNIVSLQNSLGHTFYNAPSALTPGTAYWVGIAFDQGSSSSTGQWKFGVWNLDESFAAGLTDIVTGAGTDDLGYASSANRVYLGRCDTVSDTAAYVFDHVHAVDTFDIPEVPGVNTPPIADAGPAQTAEPYATVTLDGSGSSDLEGDPLTYAWTQTAGTPVTLSSSTAAKPTFVAPAKTTGDTLTFSLVVNDGSADSDPDTVDITVLPHTRWSITNPVGPVLAPIRASLIP